MSYPEEKKIVKMLEKSKTKTWKGKLPPAIFIPKLRRAGWSFPQLKKEKK